MAALIRPHGGGSLRPLLVPAAQRTGEVKRAETLARVPLSSREVSDLFMLAMGAYTPLDGFMGHEDWRGCCTSMATSTGLFWPIPITVSCDKDVASGIEIGDDIALVDGATGEILAIQTVSEKYTINKELECRTVFHTTDPAHPGVQKVMAQAPINLGGPVAALSEGHYPDTYKGLYRRPAETRALFEAKGWSKVAAFQTRNPMHRSHEYLAKIALEICDGLLIHQVLGALKSGDIPAAVRINTISALVKNYFVADTVIQAGYPIEMRYAGPREALLHALFRQNFGCTHLVIGRDHAGVSSYYGPYDSQRIFDTLPPGSLDIQPLKIDITFYCYKCKAMATTKTCPHSSDDRLTVSGTRLREMFARREPIPEEFSRREVAAILQAYYDSIQDSGEPRRVSDLEKSSMIIAQISDTHILSKTSDDPHAEVRAGNLRRCVADINRRDVDAVIHTGDSVHHGAADEYALLREILAELKAPLFLTPGNRDRHNGIRGAFDNLHYWPRSGDFLHYAIEDYSVRLVALDSVSEGERKGVFCAERCRWLEATLAREPDRPTILFIHHPPFDVGDHYVSGYRQMQDADELAAVVSRHPQVERLLCGHVHRFHRKSWAGTTATIMPSVAVDLRKDVDAALGDTPLYVLHTWSPKGGLDSQMQVVTR